MSTRESDHGAMRLVNSVVQRWFLNQHCRGKLNLSALITLHILEREKIKTKTLIQGQEGAENDGGTETKRFEFLLCLELCLDLRIFGYLTFLGGT